MGWESNNVFQVLIIQGSAGSGLFVYSPAPGAGNLVASIAAAAGTDGFGNAFQAGFTTYNTATGARVQIQSDHIILLGQSDASGAELLTASISSGTVDSLQLISPNPSGTAITSVLDLISSAAAGTPVILIPNGALQITPPLNVPAAPGAGNGVLLYADNTPNLHLLGGGAIIPAGALAITQAAAAGLVLSVTDTTSAPSGPVSSIIANAAGDNSFGIKVAGDANYRLRVNSDGSIHVGPGTATQDTALSRAIANMWLLSGSAQFTSIAAPAAQANPVLYGAVNGQLAEVNGQGLQGGIEIAQSSNASHTVTQAALTQLSAQFTIPATDASTVGATYRITAGAQGTWGSTVQNLSIQAILAGSGVGPTAGINSGTFPASTVVNVKIEMEITIATTGAGGTFTETLTVWISDNSITTNVSRLVVRHTTGNAINTTVSNTLSLGALWNATTGAPTITCEQTIFERVV